MVFATHPCYSPAPNVLQQAVLSLVSYVLIAKLLVNKITRTRDLLASVILLALATLLALAVLLALAILLALATLLALAVLLALAHVISLPHAVQLTPFTLACAA